MSVLKNLKFKLLPSKGTLLFDHFCQLSFNKNKIDWLTDIKTKPKHPKYEYVSSLALVTADFQFFEVHQLINYWQHNDIELALRKANKHNWMYLACIKFGYLEGLDYDHINLSKTKLLLPTKIAIDRLAKYEGMSASEIHIFLEKNPVTLNGFQIINGFHRSFAMIGRFIKTGEYINMNYIKI